MSERARGDHDSIHNPRRTGLLARVGLNRPELRAWAMYDWAVSAVQTTIMVAVFPVYFVNIARSEPPRKPGDASNRNSQHDRRDRNGDTVAGARGNV